MVIGDIVRFSLALDRTKRKEFLPFFSKIVFFSEEIVHSLVEYHLILVFIVCGDEALLEISISDCRSAVFMPIDQ